MDRLTQENSALVEENTTASQHMAEEAENLEKLLNTFKVEKNESKYIDSTTINDDNLKIEQSKFEQLPEKTETVNLPNQSENFVNKESA
jgi:hypothetical protein